MVYSSGCPGTKAGGFAEGNIVRISKKAVAVAVAVMAAVGGGIAVASSASAADPVSAAGSVPNTEGSVSGWNIKNGTIFGADIDPNVVKWFTGTYNNTVTTDSVKDGALTEKDLSEAVKTKLNAVGGPAGPAGPEGPAGTKGDTGADGVSGLAVTASMKVVPTGFSEIKLDCAEGKKAISGGLKWDSGAKSEAKHVVLNGSYPSDLAETAGVSTATSWTIAITNNAPNEITVQPFLTCAATN
ncbi:hypothetical protein GCM10009741_75330 [Kribbella lupini]|uniref:Collagen triple helix repeat protein n=1 Tax=Kribbella lupini TaxID=291602 RepID=A0ABP4NEA6_9ACTN